MNGETEDISNISSPAEQLQSTSLSSGLRRFISIKKVSLLLLIIIIITAFIEFIVMGLARRTFIFYNIDSGNELVEERMLRGSGGNAFSPARETKITRYVEEVLLGPVSPNAMPLFPKGTRLLSLMYRDGVVYLDLSEDAALAPLENSSEQAMVMHNGGAINGFETLHRGLKRNFPFIREIRFFVAGKAAYAEQFR